MDVNVERPFLLLVELEPGSVVAIGVNEGKLVDINKVYLVGSEGPAVVWVVGSVVMSVGRGLVCGGEAEAGSVLGAGGGERGTPVDAVGLLVATGVEVVDAGA